ncbi:MAG: alpha/beta hydrolase [Oscillochloris sp.]|nr:alpha/beta hydrolase [Oscillochloris sp.]
MSYLHAGDTGPVIVMLHGWGAFKELWWMSMRDLGRDHRCFALDLPGHGDSYIGRADSIVGLAEAVAAFCDELGLREIILLGHSMGGCVAVEIALRRPDLLRQLFLIDAAIDSQKMPFFTRTYLQPHIGWPALRASQMLGRAFRPFGARIPHEHRGGWLRPWVRRASYLANFEPEGLYRLLRSLFTSQNDDRLAQISTPTTVISGQLDALVPAPLSRHLAMRIPNAHYVEIPAAMHNPMDERPKTFCRVVRAALCDPQKRSALFSG